MNHRLPSRRTFPCPACGHDLRGLSLADACPKCSTSVLDTFWLARAGTHRAHQATAFRLQRIWLRGVARSTGSTRSACEFVLDAVAHAPKPGWFQKRVPPDARAICEGMAELCKLTFAGPDEAREMLLRWGIRRSEDAGTILRGLVNAGLARADGVTDFDRDFAGLFVTERWLANY